MGLPGIPPGPRPVQQMVGHTGFIAVARPVGAGTGTVARRA